MICPRCKEEDVDSEFLELCEMCVCEVQAMAEERGEEIKRQFFSK